MIQDKNMTIKKSIHISIQFVNTFFLMLVQTNGVQAFCCKTTIIACCDAASCSVVTIVSVPLFLLNPFLLKDLLVIHKV